MTRGSEEEGGEGGKEEWRAEGLLTVGETQSNEEAGRIFEQGFSNRS